MLWDFLLTCVVLRGVVYQLLPHLEVHPRSLSFGLVRCAQLGSGSLCEDRKTFRLWPLLEEGLAIGRPRTAFFRMPVQIALGRLRPAQNLIELVRYSGYYQIHIPLGLGVQKLKKPLMALRYPRGLLGGISTSHHH